MTNIKINFKDNTIEVSEKFAKAASIFGSNEYKMLQEVRRDYDFPMVIKSAKKRSTFKGLDYDYMEKYIKAHNNALMEEFDIMRGYENGKKNQFADAASIGEITNWFLLKFPEIKEFNDKIEKLREKTRKEVEEQKRNAA